MIDQQLYDIIYQASFHAARAVLAFLQRDSFLYWPFLVSTLAIAMLAWRFGYARGSRAKSASWREFFRRFPDIPYSDGNSRPS